METKTNKTEIHNLIILDESGSMSGVKGSTISGCNETLNTIRSAQAEFAETQEHYVSIYLFQDNHQVPSRYLVKDAPIAMVNDINGELYRPWGGTPLYDAIGSTLADLKAEVADRKYVSACVTIITDGMENASRHYTLAQVSTMIEALKERGWSFNFIGANIDVHGTARSLSIDNAMEFQQTEEGTKAMFAEERRSRKAWFNRANHIMCCMSPDSDDVDAFEARMKESSKGFFNKD